MSAVRDSRGAGAGFNQRVVDFSEDSVIEAAGFSVEHGLAG